MLSVDNGLFSLITSRAAGVADVHITADQFTTMFVPKWVTTPTDRCYFRDPELIVFHLRTRRGWCIGQPGDECRTAVVQLASFRQVTATDCRSARSSCLDLRCWDTSRSDDSASRYEPARYMPAYRSVSVSRSLLCRSTCCQNPLLLVDGVMTSHAHFRPIGGTPYGCVSPAFARCQLYWWKTRCPTTDTD